MDGIKLLKALKIAPVSITPRLVPSLINAYATCAPYYTGRKFGVFKSNTKTCKKEENFLFLFIYEDSMTDKSQLGFLKYILGVNKYSSNLAVVSETGRLPCTFQLLFLL